MRILLWLFVGPAVALFVVSLAGPVGTSATLAAALGGQAAVYPVWRQVERQRAAGELRRLRRTPGVSVSVLRGRLTWGEATVQLGIHALCAVLLAVAFLVVTR